MKLWLHRIDGNFIKRYSEGRISNADLLENSRSAVLGIETGDENMKLQINAIVLNIGDMLEHEISDYSAESFIIDLYKFCNHVGIFIDISNKKWR